MRRGTYAFSDAWYTPEHLLLSCRDSSSDVVAVAQHGKMLLRPQLVPLPNL
jgi:hypothetical protein